MKVNQYSCRYVGSDWIEYDNGNVMEQRRAHMFVSINFCVDLACILFIQSTYPLYRNQSSTNLTALT